MNKIYVFSAPSGTGKSTIIRALMSRYPQLNLAFSISATSRKPRGAERDGVEYHFLTPEAFQQRIEAGEFLEYQEVYEGLYYGTLRSAVDAQLQAGQNVVCDIDVIGALNIKKAYGSRAVLLFIQPPSLAALRERLEARATDAPEVIEKRMQRAEFELSHAPLFDHRIVNDDLEEAIAEAFRIINKE